MEQKKKALIIEDNELEQKAIYFILKNNGYESTIVSKGTEALKKMNKKYSLYIIDSELEDDVPGIRIAKNIRGNYKNSVIIINSTKNFDEEAKKINAIYVNKDHMQLEEIIKNLK